MSMHIDKVSFASVKVTPRTTWYFAEIVNSNGLVTVDEFTKGPSSVEVAKLIQNILTHLSGKLVDTEADIESILNYDRILDGRSVEAAAISAIRTSITQLSSMEKGISLGHMLGGSGIKNIPVYANINRGLFATDRTPRDFAVAAEDAAKQNFSIIKCAPFDEVNPLEAPTDILKAADIGLARVNAIRSSVGESITILIDCHSRFTTETASHIAEKLEALSIGWFEEPLSPNDYGRALSELVNNVSIPLAGGETGYGQLFFDGLLSNGSVEIIMPDIKYCGGVSESVRIGRSALSVGGSFSLHSPSGPVSLLASAHATAAVKGSMALEHAVFESDWRYEITDPPEVIKDGHIQLHEGPGLGVGLNREVITKRGEIFPV